MKATLKKRDSNRDETAGMNQNAQKQKEAAIIT